MEIFGSVLSGFFIALLVATGLTFGIVLIFWFIGLGVGVSLLLLLRRWWWRWRFLHNASQSAEKPMENPLAASPRIIEAEYEDITDS